MNRSLFTLLFFFLVVPSMQGQQNEYHNPVIRGDVPDPSILRIDDTYYATGTSAEWAPQYPVFVSKDLINWKQTGHIFQEVPEWTSQSFWAPELYYYNNKVYCYYTARRKSDGTSYIGVAVANSPTETFTDHGLLVEYGTEAIDASVYNDNGQLYISWKAYGLDNRPIELLGSKLSSDGLKLEGEPFSLLKDDEGKGMEGQYHFKKGDYYYLIYAAHSCCGPLSDYDVYVARSKDFKGPYEKYEGNPILYGGERDFQSCGHGTIVVTPDDRLFYLCHAYLPEAGFYAGRQPILQEIGVGEDNWLHFKTGTVAQIKQPVPFKGTKQESNFDFKDEFKDESLKVDWTWSFPFSDPQINIGNGKLYLSGNPKGSNQYGTALCVRANSPHYTYETQNVNPNKSIGGLTMYGDDKNLIIWGTTNNKLQLKLVEEGKETILFEHSLAQPSVFLKIEVTEGCHSDFYWSSNGKKWSKVDTPTINFKKLVRWERVPRPGLIHIGDSTYPVEFSYFKLENI
ncbi:family 43 glycosylhydrolase [Bacteroides sp.]|uniref:family 43 glycosylhydrolase n=1 Tax=Bacteroides sp. TaxID=29523 RepID=UPI00260B9DF4|nr:family 43 glycosylhydrolase [Bacteroides sp.]